MLIKKKIIYASQPFFEYTAQVVYLPFFLQKTKGCPLRKRELLWETGDSSSNEIIREA